MALDYEHQRKIYDLLYEQYQQYPEMKTALEDIFKKQKELLQTQYANKAEELSFETGESIFDFMTQYRGAQGRSGFGESGALERGRERGLGRLQRGHEFGRQSLYDTFQERQLGAEKEYLGELSALDQWRANLKTQAAGLDTDLNFFDMLWQGITSPIEGATNIWESIF